MKRFSLILASAFIIAASLAGNVGKTFYFNNYDVKYQGIYATIHFQNATLAGKTGEPALPYLPVSLILPPGEKAVSIEITGEDETIIPGTYMLFPKQEVRPISQGYSGRFNKNEEVYRSSQAYPAKSVTQVQTQYLNGYAFALATFTPVRYNPAAGTISYYSRVTISVTTEPDQKSQKTLSNLTTSKDANDRVRAFAQNPEMMAEYPQKKSTGSDYQLLIITPSAFESGFSELVSMYQDNGVISNIVTTETINSNMTGQDLQDKIRNYIIQEYQNNNIEYVLLGGDVDLVPYRGFYCYVVSGSGYEDYDIPADLYYSGLDGNWNTNGDDKWGEPGEDDLLPDVAVARMPFGDVTEQAAMTHKSISYQTSPVLGEFDKPFFVGEHLYDDPNTEGGDYMDLLISNHDDNGYFTFGISPFENHIKKLYDQNIPGGWATDSLLEVINTGRSFIHHLGHANSMYVMRLYTWDITNENFSMVNGVDHNYTFVYTQGCDCGAFNENNPDCIAEKMVTIENFCVAGVFNTRYGWFDQGTTDGPSQHLQREFVSAYNNDTLPIIQIGATQMMSKIKTAPYVGLPGEFEPGAQRWCHYDCNLLGDPVMPIMTHDPGTQGIANTTIPLNFSVYPNPAKDRISLTVHSAAGSVLNITLLNPMGQQVSSPKEISTGTAVSVTTTIDLSNLAPGVYLCKVENGKASGVKKIVVTR